MSDPWQPKLLPEKALDAFKRANLNLGDPNGPTYKVSTPKGHISVVETVYHQLTDGQPIAVESRFSRSTETDEQPYQRKITVTEEWKSIDHGWIEQVGMLHLSNEEGVFSVMPTEEEKQEVLEKIVEIGVAEIQSFANAKISFSPANILVCLIILPQESMRVVPYDIPRLRIRCRKGTAKCIITLFPA
jgi:hypothetical protein